MRGVLVICFFFDSVALEITFQIQNIGEEIIHNMEIYSNIKRSRLCGEKIEQLNRKEAGCVRRRGGTVVGERWARV